MNSAQARAAANGATAVQAGAVAVTQVSGAPLTGASAKAATRLSKAARQKAKAAKAVSVAKRQVGAPYRWGGTGPRAFDCSGLAQYSWRKAGVRLPRITHSQYRAVRKKVSWRSLRPGDLLFFYGKGHVGIYVGKGRMVHAPSSGRTVRIVKLKNYYRSSFAGAVRPGV